MEIIQRVESALKATAPIVGIPLPGERPFCVKRDLLVKSLKGLKIVDAAIQLPLDTNGRKILVVYAASERCQAIRKYYPIGHNWLNITKPIHEWAEAQREKRSKPRLSGREKKIGVLERKLAKLGKPTPPQHPLLYRDRWHESLQEYDARQRRAWDEISNGSQHELLTLGQQWARFKAEAPVRVWIQAQARQCKQGKFNTAELYRRLRDRGLNVRKWSDLNTHEKERCEVGHKYDGLHGYLSMLWQFCGIAGKVSYWFEPANHYDTPGAKHYESWLEHLHEYKELEAMIASLQQLN